MFYEKYNLTLCIVGKNNAEILCAILKECGYCFDGTQVMYHGHTGIQIPQRIFLGMAYYQRLKHNADDKIQARSRGPLEMLTRQATHGKLFCYFVILLFCYLIIFYVVYYILI